MYIYYNEMIKMSLICKNNFYTSIFKFKTFGICLLFGYSNIRLPFTYDGLNFN